MRRGHLIIIFGILLVSLFVGALIKRTDYKRAVNEKRDIDYALQMSVDAAAEQLARTYQDVSLSSYLVSASDMFFTTMAAGMNLYEEEDQQAELTFFVPALMVTYTDGFYVNYLSESDSDGSLTPGRAWTECQPYTFSDDFFIYRFFLDDRVIVYEKATGVCTDSSLNKVMADPRLMADFSVGKVFLSEETYYEYKRAAVAESIASVLDRIVNEHSRIAGQLGISTVYGVPDFLSGFTPAQEYPSFIAVFQGYPLTSDARIIYNGASTSAAYISKVTRYSVEISTGPAQPFSVFHRDGCMAAGSYGQMLAEKYTQKEAVVMYGAYACPYCFSDEDSAPVLP